jgi:hypothetical protein
VPTRSGGAGGNENTPRQRFKSAALVDSHLRRLDRADAGQLLGVRDEVYRSHDAVGDVEDERRDRLAP